MLWKERSFVSEEREDFQEGGALELVFENGEDLGRIRWLRALQTRCDEDGGAYLLMFRAAGWERG